MNHVHCNYCGQVVQFVPIRGNSVCPVCRQSSTSCCDGDSCSIPMREVYTPQPARQVEEVKETAVNEPEKIMV
jgi:hypothetical protein